MNETIISQICTNWFSQQADTIKRCSTGYGNYVYLLETAGSKYIVRCSSEKGAYNQTVHWLKKLAGVKITVPEVICQGTFRGFEYIILSYLEGEDLGTVYPQLTAEDKRTIAKEVVEIQQRAAALNLESVDSNWSWHTFIDEMLARARARIAKNGYFDTEKVDRLSKAVKQLDRYFTDIKPIAYLDDISTKNLLIYDRRVSGVIDVDWIGIGDRLTYAALTNMALLNLQYDTEYVKYLLDEMQVNDMEQKAFLFYTLMFCVDFMGERGTRFIDRTVEVNQGIIHHLNNIYNQLWKMWVERG